MGLEDEELTLWPTLTTYFAYGIIIAWGYSLDFIDRLLGRTDKQRKGYAPITRDFEAFFRRRVYGPVSDPWNRPITGPANDVITVLERKRDRAGRYELTGSEKKAVNLSSYNYLGFAVLPKEKRKMVEKALGTYGASTGSSSFDAGYTKAHEKLEATVAEFLQVEAALAFGMGWGTNATALPALVGKQCLIISDSANHASIAVGARSTGAKIRVFKHNDVEDLERVIVNSICGGQPRTRRPWKKILIVVEGIYSMEGTTCPLRQIVALKKKYRCYLYLDEAHSIGALGKNGRGLCEFAGVKHSDIDILMGTFTKSFGAIGGYIAGSRRLVESVRRLSASSSYSSGLSPVCTAMVQTAFDIIMGRDGSTLGEDKLRQLKDNSNFFRSQMQKLGYQVLGDIDSPIIPILIANPGKLIALSRECLKRGLAVVAVGFPATSLVASRIRFCISASHTRKQLEDAVKAFDEMGDLLRVKYTKRAMG